MGEWDKINGTPHACAIVRIRRDLPPLKMGAALAFLFHIYGLARRWVSLSHLFCPLTDPLVAFRSFFVFGLGPCFLLSVSPSMKQLVACHDSETVPTKTVSFGTCVEACFKTFFGVLFTASFSAGYRAIRSWQLNRKRQIILVSLLALSFVASPDIYFHMRSP